MKAARIVALIVLSSPLLLFPVLGYWSIAPGGSGGLQYFTSFMMMPVIPGVLVLLAAAFAVLIRDLRRVAIQALLFSAVYVGASVVGFGVGEELRDRALHAFTARSATLIEAIRSYESQNGAPPPELAALVPDYIAAIPSPGLADNPDYQYITGDTAKSSYHGNAWVLTVSPPAINFDQLLFFPLQNYPKQGYGGSLQRIDDWAYVNE